MDKDDIVQKLEAEAARLSRENNPHNIGNDVLVYSIAQLIKSLNKSDKD
jgi:hypothetical protein